MNKDINIICNEAFNTLLPFIEEHKDFISHEFFKYFFTHIQFKEKDGSEFRKQLIGFNIYITDGNFPFIYIDAKYLEESGQTHFNTFSFYSINEKKWNFFWLNLTVNDKTGLANFITKGLVRKMKIHKLIS